MAYEDFLNYRDEENRRHNEDRNRPNKEQVEALRHELEELKKKFETVEDSISQMDQIDKEIDRIKDEKREIDTILRGLSIKIKHLEETLDAAKNTTDLSEEDWIEHINLVQKVTELNEIWNKLFDELLKIDELIDSKREEMFKHMETIDEVTGNKHPPSNNG